MSTLRAVKSQVRISLGVCFCHALDDRRHDVPWQLLHTHRLSVPLRSVDALLQQTATISGGVRVSGESQQVQAVGEAEGHFVIRDYGHEAFRRLRTGGCLEVSSRKLCFALLTTLRTRCKTR